MRAVPMMHRLSHPARLSRDRRYGPSLRLSIFVAVLGCLAGTFTQPSRGADSDPAIAPSPTSRPADAVRAADTRPASNVIARAWAELTHRDPAVREAARVKLMAMDADQLPAFRRLVAASRPLAPSQAIVLREIVTQVFLAGQTYEPSGHQGFLGVRLNEVTVNLRPEAAAAVELPDQILAGNEPDSAHGIVIVERIPGFCGARAFQDGDIVLSIDERPEVRIGPMGGGFTEAVRSFGPGQTIHFRVLRQGRVTRVPLTLDARPMDADRGGVMDPLRDFQDERARLAREYWDAQFAPLVKETVG
jgi:hypothetical protein